MNPRRRLLTVIVREVPSPIPRPGEPVTLYLGTKDEGPTEGRVHQSLGYGILRVEVVGDLPEIRP